MAKQVIKPIALFFYAGTLSQANATKVEAYFSRGGYRTYFRRDVAGQRDIVEQHVKIVGGGSLIPQRYVDAYLTDTTRILDTENDLADILANDALVPPTVTPAEPEEPEEPSPPPAP